MEVIYLSLKYVGIQDGTFFSIWRAVHVIDQNKIRFYLEYQCWMQLYACETHHLLKAWMRISITAFNHDLSKTESDQNICTSNNRTKWNNKSSTLICFKGLCSVHRYIWRNIEILDCILSVSVIRDIVRNESNFYSLNTTLLCVRITRIETSNNQSIFF